MSIQDYNNKKPFDNIGFQTYLQKIEGLKHNRVEFVKKMIEQFGNTPISDEDIMNLKIDMWVFGNQERYEKRKMR